MRNGDNKSSVGGIKKNTPAELNTAAHKEADKDIEKDPELSNKPAPEDDLDETELAQLEGEE